MCIGVPMRVVSVSDWCAECEAQGQHRQVSLLFLPDPRVAAGDYLMVHLNRATRRLTAEEADEVWKLLEMLTVDGLPDDRH